MINLFMFLTVFLIRTKDLAADKKYRRSVSRSPKTDFPSDGALDF